MWKGELLLKQVNAGCSETYWFNVPDWGEAQDQMMVLANLRKGFMPEIASVQGYRLGEMTANGLVTGRSQSFNLEANGINGVPGTLRDNKDSCMLTRSQDATGKITRKQWLRFLPDEWIAFDVTGKFVPNALLTTAFTAFANELKNGMWYIRQFDTNANSNPVNCIIEELGFDPEGMMYFVGDGSFSQNELGQKLKIRKYNGKFGKECNGIHRILGIEDTRIFLDKRSSDYRGESGPGGGGKAFIENYTFTSIADVVMESGSAHDTGRSFFQPRGRRSKQKPRHVIPVDLSFAGSVGPIGLKSALGGTPTTR